MKLFALILFLGTVLAENIELYNQGQYEHDLNNDYQKIRNKRGWFDDFDFTTESLSSTDQDEHSISEVHSNQNIFQFSEQLPLPLNPLNVSFDSDIYSITQYDNFVLICKTSREGTEVIFEKVGEGSIGSNVHQDGNVLRFDGFHRENRGVYECKAKSNGLIAKASVIMDIWESENLQVEIDPSELQVVQVGDYVLLKCQVVAGNPVKTLKWTRSDPELLSDRVEEISDGIILISNITAAEASDYACHASSDSEEIIKTTTVSIQQPSLNIFPNLPEISLTEGDTLSLLCTAKISSNAIWFKLDAVDKDENIGQSFFGNTKSVTYVKYNVSRNEEGTYVCRASHRNMKFENQIKVSIRPKEGENESTEASVIDVCSNPNPCKNNGICETNGNTYTCICPIHFTGILCELFIPAVLFSHYKGNSFIELNSSTVVGAPYQTIISFGMAFRTTESNGLLIWYGQNDGEAFDVKDYMALAVVDGYLEFSLRVDDQEMTIKSEKRVNDEEIHWVVITRNGKDALLQVGFRSDKGIPKTIESKRNFSYLPGNVFVGGAPNIIKTTGNRYKQGFKGCIYVVQSMQNSSWQDVDIHNSAVAGYGVSSCSLM